MNLLRKRPLTWRDMGEVKAFVACIGWFVSWYRYATYKPAPSKLNKVRSRHAELQSWRESATVAADALRPSNVVNVSDLDGIRGYRQDDGPMARDFLVRRVYSEREKQRALEQAKKWVKKHKNGDPRDRSETEKQADVEQAKKWLSEQHKPGTKLYGPYEGEDDD